MTHAGIADHRNFMTYDGHWDSLTHLSLSSHGDNYPAVIIIIMTI